MSTVTVPERKSRRRRLVALRIAAIYALVGGLWILFSDKIVAGLSDDSLMLTHLQTFKGWFYVFATAWLLYILVARAVAATQRSEDEIAMRREHECLIQVEAEDAKREFYRGTIFAVTDGKLNLVSQDEVVSLLAPDAAELPLSGERDLSKFRAAIAEMSAQAGMCEERVESLIIAVGEAAANAVKHAGGGLARFGMKNGIVQVCVQDDGSGMDSLVLPRATLLKGFSTKPSMGLGYSLILASVDAVFLATGPRGTWVLMEQRLEESTPELDLADLSGNW